MCVRLESEELKVDRKQRKNKLQRQNKTNKRIKQTKENKNKQQKIERAIIPIITYFILSEITRVCDCLLDCKTPRRALCA